MAIPLGFFLTNTWLNNFAYRIGLSWKYFALSILATAVIALLTVGYHSLKAAMDNPTKNLRYE